MSVQAWWSEGKVVVAPPYINAGGRLAVDTRGCITKQKYACC